MSVKHSIILYHGSYMPIHDVDLSKCKPWKDFGRGFYLTENYKQALDFAKKKCNEINKKDGKYIPCVTKFEFIPDDKLLIHEFEDANKSWLETVLGYRTKGDKYNSSFGKTDVIVGKIADDGTKVVLTAALNGLFGPLSDRKTLDSIVKQLEPDNLERQYCFKTQKSLKYLINCGYKYATDKGGDTGWNQQKKW